MESLLDILSWILLLTGGAFGLIGGIGLLRMPDLFTRMHAAGLIDTLAVALIIFGMMLQAGWTLVAMKLAIILALVLFTSPTASHALAKAALHGGVRPRTVGGELLEHKPGETLELESSSPEPATLEPSPLEPSPPPGDRGTS